MQRDEAHPIVQDLILVGGGHSHIAVLKRFGMRPMPGVRLTLVSRDVLTPYSGMLPGYIAGHYSFAECHIDLVRLAAFAGARFYHDDAVGIDRAARRLLCATRPPVPYDLLSLDIGSRPKQSDVQGSAEHATPVKPIDGFARRWERIVARVSSDDRPLRIGVVGGGAGGVELVLAMHYRLRRLASAQGQDPERLAFVLVTAGELLASHNEPARGIFRRVLGERKIEIRTESEVVAVADGRLTVASGAEIALDEILWVTQAGAAPWLAASGLACDPLGFVRARDTLETVSDPRIFAAGDVAAVDSHPRPKAGVFAVRQGRPLAANLRRVLAGKPPRPFRPQRQFLSLISTGDRYAVATRGRWAAAGAALWRLKDWIDRRFMRKYTDLPEMRTARPPVAPTGTADAEALQAISSIAMRCGGCGAKVGSTVLSRVMARLDIRSRDEVIVGVDAPDDAALVRAPVGKALVQTVDYFRAFLEDPYVFGRIAANHALGDVYAMGGEPLSALAIATIPYGIERKVEDDLFQMMSGALTVLNDAQCALVGGHTSEGAELALGFAITGTVREQDAMRKRGLAPGNALILTKPLGTGTLLAAAMRGKAEGAWLDRALADMLISARDAAQCLGRYGATACTDVTGFGLIGHLVEMTKPSGVDVELELAAIPVLDGARQTVEAGIFSSLQPENLRIRRAIDCAAGLSEDPRVALLFDPQTAGGLLAGIPAERAEACVGELRRSGYPRAAIIGRVLAGTAAPAPIRIVERATPAAFSIPRPRVTA